MVLAVKEATHPVHLVQDVDEVCPCGLPVESVSQRTIFQFLHHVASQQHVSILAGDEGSLGHAPVAHERRKQRGQVVPRDDDGHALYPVLRARQPQLGTCGSMRKALTWLAAHVALMPGAKTRSRSPPNWAHLCAPGLARANHIRLVCQVHQRAHHHLRVYLPRRDSASPGLRGLQEHMMRMCTGG